MKTKLSPARELDFQGPGDPQIDTKSFEIQLGKQLGTKSDAKLAYDTEFWSQDCQVDDIWTAKSRQMGARRAS